VVVRDPLSRLAMSQVTTLNWPFQTDVAEYARHGWTGMEVWLHKLMPPGRRYAAMPEEPVPAETIAQARALIDHHGLTVSGVVLSGGYTHADGRARERQLQHTIWGLRACRALGTDCLLMVPGAAGELPRSVARELTIECLRAAVPTAKAEGVRLAIEPLHPRHSDFVNTIGDALDLVEAVDDPLCGVFVDTYQVWETPHLGEEIARAGDRIFGVHLADAPIRPSSLEDRRIPGDGDLPLQRMVDAIEATGYTGPYALELMAPELWNSDYGNLLDRCAQAARALLI
jgi:sugar phosphate isomerase/epimerase